MFGSIMQNYELRDTGFANAEVSFSASLILMPVRNEQLNDAI